MPIIENLEKSKAIAHDVRRADRSKKMAPLDVQATIPSQSQKAEEKRDEIRKANALVQQHIDDASTVGDIKVALAEL